MQQQKPQLFGDYEHFCIQCLKNINNRYFIDREYHDLQYFEIDANIYSYEETKKLFKDNKNTITYLEDQEAKVMLRKNTYNFDLNLQNFIQRIKNGFDEDFYQHNPYISIFWEQDGTFKNISDVLHNPRFVPNSLLSTKILTSDQYISTVSINDITQEEKQELIYQIEQAIMALNINKKNVEKLYNERKISVFEYQISTQIIDNEIQKKEKYKKIDKSIKRKK